VCDRVLSCVLQCAPVCFSMLLFICSVEVCAGNAEANILQNQCICDLKKIHNSFMGDA